MIEREREREREEGGGTRVTIYGPAVTPWEIDQQKVCSSFYDLALFATVAAAARTWF